MAETRAPPTFHAPKLVQTPEVLGGLNEQSFILDGILYRTFKTILPVDPQELSVHSRSISFYILDKVALINPHR